MSLLIAVGLAPFALLGIAVVIGGSIISQKDMEGY
jgi:hypothetical protein